MVAADRLLCMVVVCQSDGSSILPERLASPEML